MFWTVRRANTILALRCSYLNGALRITGRTAGQLLTLNSNFHVANPEGTGHLTTGNA